MSSGDHTGETRAGSHDEEANKVCIDDSLERLRLWPGVVHPSGENPCAKSRARTLMAQDHQVVAVLVGQRLHNTQ